MPPHNDQLWQLNWPHGHAEIQEWGGMLGPVWFRLKDGREFQPMHVAPWADENSALGLTGLLAHLRGEWPCVPFGGKVAPNDMPAGWTTRTADHDNFFHGFAAHNRWESREEREGYIHLGIEYPGDSPIIALDRWICGDRNRPTLNVTLGIRVRREIDLPVALHLTFRMPAAIGSLHLSAAEVKQIVSYPLQVEPGISRLRPNQRSHSLTAVASLEGNLDLSHLPLPFATEELVQLVDCRGAICLNYLDENACVLLDWDNRFLPDALLWISNGGRFYTPWSGRHFALGVEPVAGPFDLGRVAVPPSAHPLTNRLLRLSPSRQTKLVYTLTALSM